MKDSYQRCYVDRLPQEVLHRCILPYLSPRDRHAVLSANHTLSILLPEVRTIMINSLRTFVDDSHNTEHHVDYFSPVKRIWDGFCNSASLRHHLLRLVGCLPQQSTTSSSSSSTTTARTNQRKLRLHIEWQQGREHQALLMEYAEYFESMQFENVTKITPKLQHPTASLLQRWFQSKMIRLPSTTLDLIHLYSLLQVESKLTFPDEPSTVFIEGDPRLSNLRGIRRLVINMAGFNPTCFIEFGEIHDTLIEIHINNCPEWFELTLLAHIPKVWLTQCVAITDVTPLSTCQYVSICGNMHTLDVSPLQHVPEVVLTSIHTSNLHLLGNVQKLTLSTLLAEAFPIACGIDQEWKLEKLAITELSAFAQVYSLCLLQCYHILDYSAVHAIRYLTIASDLQHLHTLPKPTGRLQEWHFQETLYHDAYPNYETEEMVQTNFEFLSNLEGLFKLTLTDCKSVEALEVPILHIPKVEISHCDFVAIVQIGHVEELKLRNLHNCHSVSTLENIAHLHIEDCSLFISKSLEITSKTNLKSLMVVSGSATSLALANDVCLTSLPTLRRLVVKDCPYLKDVKAVLEARRQAHGRLDISIMRCPAVEPLSSVGQQLEAGSEDIAVCRKRCQLDNFTIRIAVNEWYWDAAHATAMYGDISTWDVSQVTDMRYLFYNRVYFNACIEAWDVRNVTSMQGMFYKAKLFNQPLAAWNVSRVTNMVEMFAEAKQFQQPLSSWQVHNVLNMTRMFANAIKFEQNLSTWELHPSANLSGMLSGSLTFPNKLPPLSPEQLQAISYNQLNHRLLSSEYSDEDSDHDYPDDYGY